MWAEFPERFPPGRDRRPSPRRLAPRPFGWRIRRGAGPLLLVGAVILGLGPRDAPSTAPFAADRGEFSAGPAAERQAAFRPGGVAIGRAAAGAVPRWRSTDGCLAVGQSDQGTQEQAELGRLMEILARSPTGAAVLRQATDRQVHVCADRETRLLAYYFANMNVVGISWDLSEGGRIIFLAHELAHIPQHPRYSDNRLFPPEELVLLRRIREAAAEATATRIAWELRQAGFAAAWREKLATPYADVARAFERAATAQKDTEAPLLSATRAAFDQWFAVRWRRDVYDRMTVAHLRRISTDATGLVPPRRTVTQQFLLPIGRHRDGNFLAGSGDRPLTDSYFAGQLSEQIAKQIKRFHRLSSTARRSVAAGMLTDVVS